MSYRIDHKAVLAVVAEAGEKNRAIAKDILDDAQIHAPVDTGHLKASGFIDGAGPLIRIGFTAHYAGYQEFGTRYITPKYFLTRAALQRRG